MWKGKYTPGYIHPVGRIPKPIFSTTHKRGKRRAMRVVYPVSGKISMIYIWFPKPSFSFMCVYTPGFRRKSALKTFSGVCAILCVIRHLVARWAQRHGRYILLYQIFCNNFFFLTSYHQMSINFGRNCAECRARVVSFASVHKKVGTRQMFMFCG